MNRIKDIPLRAGYFYKERESARKTDTKKEVKKFLKGSFWLLGEKNLSFLYFFAFFYEDQNKRINIRIGF